MGWWCAPACACVCFIIVLDNEALSFTRLPPRAGGIRGRTLYYAFSDYLKLGMYRDPAITYDSTIFLDELRCGPTKESVALPPMEEATTRFGAGEEGVKGRRGR